MMGHQPRRELLFHYFSLEDQVPADHLLRLIDRYVDFSFVRDRLHPTYSETGRPSIDPEVLVRVLLIGYLYGITSERRLMDEIRMHLAYRWFTGLGFDQPIPDHSTVSKHRHGRFRESGVFREIFEEIVARCQAAGLVDGRHLSVDGTLVHADASRQPRVSRSAEGVRTLEAHLADVDQQNPVAAPRRRAKVSPTDPDAAWATKGGPATFAYFDHYLVDTASRIILDVDASPARFREESLAARRMVDRVIDRGLRPTSLGADKAYGSGEFLTWRLARNIQPHIPVIDRRHQTEGRFTRDDFRYVPDENVFICPDGQRLRYRGVGRQTQVHVYCSTRAQCRGCPQKDRCTSGATRRVTVHWHEPARQITRALAGTPAFVRSQRDRQLVEGLFGELKQQMWLRRVRLRRLWNVAEQFHLAATAQNLKRLVGFLAQRHSAAALSTA